jgi:xanthine dehydrogenase accessory factor
LKSPATHVLMIASRRKADRLRDVMRMRGIDEGQLARLVAPTGPDAGAKTPGEIALVAIVGVLAFLRGRAHVSVNSQAQPMAADATEQVPDKANSRQDVVTGASETKFINPVCGMAVDITAPKHIEQYQGIAYYFCCDGCLTTFRQDPAKYAAIHRASAGRSST